MALGSYCRWYILAHSLGSVAAWNGLMETEHCLPNYLDEARWRRLQEADSGKEDPERYTKSLSQEYVTKHGTQRMQPSRGSFRSGLADRHAGRIKTEDVGEPAVARWWNSAHLACSSLVYSCH